LFKVALNTIALTPVNLYGIVHTIIHTYATQ
jgi:hypothetical protein